VRLGLWLDPGDVRQAYHSFAEEMRNGFIMFKYPLNDANRRHPFPTSSTDTGENTSVMLKPLTDELQISINRWKSEISGNRSTLAYGILAKGMLQFEQVLDRILFALVPLLGADGKAHLKLLLGGQQLNNCALSLKSNILTGLNSDFENALRTRLSSVPVPLLTKVDTAALNAVVRFRNQFAHNRMLALRPATKTVLECIEMFCASELCRAIWKLQAQQSSAVL
jgi:hypothetical protein